MSTALNGGFTPNVSFSGNSLHPVNPPKYPTGLSQIIQSNAEAALGIIGKHIGHQLYSKGFSNVLATEMAFFDQVCKETRVGPLSWRLQVLTVNNTIRENMLKLNAQDVRQLNNEIVKNAIKNLDGARLAAYAVDKNCPVLFKLLLNSGLDANSTHQGESLLLYAIRRDNVRIVQILVEAGAHFNEVDGNGVTPVMFAILEGRVDSARVLARFGADVNARSRPNAAFGQSSGVMQNAGKTALMLLLEGQGQINAHDLVVLLQIPGLDLEVRSPEGETALMILVRHLVRYNLQGRGFTQDELMDFLSILIRVGAAAEVQDGLGQTPLMLAASMGNAKIVQQLIRTMFFHMHETAAALSASSFSIHSSSSSSGSGSSSSSSNSFNPDHMERLSSRLEEEKKFLERRDSTGRTAVMIAVERMRERVNQGLGIDAYVETIRLLIDAGADLHAVYPIEHPEHPGVSVCDLMQQYGFTEWFPWLAFALKLDK